MRKGIKANAEYVIRQMRSMKSVVYVFSMEFALATVCVADLYKYIICVYVTKSVICIFC